MKCPLPARLVALLMIGVCLSSAATSMSQALARDDLADTTPAVDSAAADDAIENADVTAAAEEAAGQRAEKQRARQIVVLVTIVTGIALTGLLLLVAATVIRAVARRWHADDERTPTRPPLAPPETAFPAADLPELLPPSAESSAHLDRGETSFPSSAQETEKP